MALTNDHVAGRYGINMPYSACEPSAASKEEAGLARAFNVGLALLIILFFAPLLLTVAAITRLSDGGPAIFAHRRVGRNGKPFYCLKFRSMAVDAEARLAALIAADPAARAEWEATHKLKQDPRVTRWGAFLRVSSLDELPQLFNVVRGEMNIVGPRPIVQGETHHYGRYIHNYSSVRPGMTGLWQVCGRSDTTYRRRVAMDVRYVQHKSLWFDLKILVLTVGAVLARRGSY